MKRKYILTQTHTHTLSLSYTKIKQQFSTLYIKYDYIVFVESIIRMYYRFVDKGLFI